MTTGVLQERLRHDRFFRLGLALVTLVVVAAVLAPWLAPFDPLPGDPRNAYLLGPGGAFVLGTDTQGRDVLSRVLFGARSQVLVLERAEFVLAAQALGALDRRVLPRHLLLNVRTQVLIAATLGIAVPGFNLVGDALREAYDPKLHTER